MNQSKVTVIVPVYNVEKYIKRCVDSILNQSYENLEIILVDDGSPDGCGKILEQYKKDDERVRVIHQKNGGQSKARNEALKIATGDYYCFVDSDDYMHEDQIQRLIELLYDYSADISMTHFCNFTGDLISPKDIQNNMGNNGLSSFDKKIIEFSNTDCIKNMHMVSDELYVVMWGKLFKRELFEDVEFPEGRICEDLAILYKLFDKAKNIVYSQEVLYYYFRDNSSSSTFAIKDKFYDDVFLALEEEINYMDNKHQELVNYPKKTYMYWILDYYRKLYLSDSNANKNKCKDLHKKYKKLYGESKEMNKEKFYTFFNYFPNLYINLKK